MVKGWGGTMGFSTFNINDMLEQLGVEEVNRILLSFSCPINVEIEDFVHSKAVLFAKQKLSVTYLVFNESSDFLGFFALASKVLTLSGDRISKTLQKKILRYGLCCNDGCSIQSFAYLIAQFGKNYSISPDKRINGNELMACAFDALHDIQHRLGGGLSFLECEEKPELLNFYQNEYNRFTIAGERTATMSNVKYIQLIRLF